MIYNDEKELTVILKIEFQQKKNRLDLWWLLQAVTYDNQTNTVNFGSPCTGTPDNPLPLF